MTELLAQLWTPEVKMAVMAVLAVLVVLYVLCIVWVVRDAYMRGARWYLWVIISLVPVLGPIVYSIMRPPLMQMDRNEQELEIALKQRQLAKYGECAQCGYPVEADYVLCPQCHTQLKNLCARCDRALDPAWTVCPYCATPVAPAGADRRAARRRSHAAAALEGENNPRLEA
ncbi:MAG: zinc ribbon domain-containing protein [Eggerthellaceae bacterium]|nr:zinc ribbon domain-containing protein [Eggerthellaceae bacterium]